MSAVLSVQRFGNPAGQPAIFSKMEMQLSPFLDATFWNYCLQKTQRDTYYYSRNGKISCRDIARQIKGVPYEALLDVGCGTGFLIDMLTKQRQCRISRNGCGSSTASDWTWKESVRNMTENDNSLIQVCCREAPSCRGGQMTIV